MKKKIYVVLSSITFATQLKNTLENNYVDSRICQTPKQLSKRGCAYSVVINKSDISLVLEVVKSQDFKLLGVYEKQGADMYEPIF